MNILSATFNMGGQIDKTQNVVTKLVKRTRAKATAVII